MGMTPDQISTLSPGELHAIRAAFIARRVDDFQAISLAVTAGIAKALGGQEE